MGSKILAIVVLATVLAAVTLPLIARTAVAQNLREDCTRIMEDLVEKWADCTPRLEEIVLYRLAKVVVALIDFLD